MGTATELSIANRALLSIGARTQISSFSPSDGSVEADAISVLWTPTYEALARTAQWACLRQQRVLGLLAAAQGTPENPDGTSLPIPPQPWLYAYSYPSDCLMLRWIVPTFPAYTGSDAQTTASVQALSWVPGGAGQIPFAVSNSQDADGNPILIILTNQENAQAVYTINQPNPATWDSLFQAAMVASLGAYLVPALSLSLPLMQLSIQTAERHIALARAQDGNEGVTSQDHIPDWIQARNGGQGYGWGGYNFTGWGQLETMLWPDYSGF